MPEYSAKLNLEKPLGTENVNRGFFTRLIDDIDSKAGAPNGLARLDQNGNVLKSDGSLAGEVTAAQFTEHKEERSSVQKAGHVQLSDAISSTDTTKAATSNAVKKAYDRAEAAFTSASNGKTAIKNAVAGVDPRVSIPADPTFEQLATAIGKIETGLKWASGNFTKINTPAHAVGGLAFKPDILFLWASYGGRAYRWAMHEPTEALLHQKRFSDNYSTKTIEGLAGNEAQYNDAIIPTSNGFILTNNIVNGLNFNYIAIKL